MSHPATETGCQAFTDLVDQSDHILQFLASELTKIPFGVHFKRAVPRCFFHFLGFRFLIHPIIDGEIGGFLLTFIDDPNFGAFLLFLSGRFAVKFFGTFPDIPEFAEMFVKDFLLPGTFCETGSQGHSERFLFPEWDMV